MDTIKKNLPLNCHAKSIAVFSLLQPASVFIFYFFTEKIFGEIIRRRTQLHKRKYLKGLFGSKMKCFLRNYAKLILFNVVVFAMDRNCLKGGVLRGNTILVMFGGWSRYLKKLLLHSIL